MSQRELITILRKLTPGQRAVLTAAGQLDHPGVVQGDMDAARKLSKAGLVALDPGGPTGDGRWKVALTDLGREAAALTTVTKKPWR